jgi:NAD(P)-dependent dehydrogenase (short-subunit alcohol dehydrogenase family)
LGVMEKNELNSLVEFLSSEASDYITGSTIVIDGGRSII